MTTLDELIADSWFPFEGNLIVKPLDPEVIPEPPRHGLDAAECHACQRTDSDCVWTDEHWRLAPYRPTQVRGIVLLETRRHLDSFLEFGPELLAAIGPMMARVERALLDLGGVARVHVNRWGDGGAHFHLWFMPRPLGMLQLRGSMLPMWLDVLPEIDEDAAEAAFQAIGLSIARGSVHG